MDDKLTIEKVHGVMTDDRRIITESGILALIDWY